MRERMGTTAHVAPQVLAGRYQLIKELAQGGMGAVWTATDVVCNDTVAVKLLRSDLSDEATARFRFGREIRAMARLHHPGIVRIRDYGEDQRGRPFYVMDLLDGRPLSGYKRNSFPVPLLLHLFDEVLAALAYVHARGVIHRDLKPENILLTRDSLRRFHATLVDFGIASVTQEGSSLGTPMQSMVGGFVVGTPEYMAPEQVQGMVHEIGPECDLYAIGVMLFEYVTGKVPFAGNTPLATATLQLTQPVPEVIPAQPQVTPEGLSALIQRLLHKDAWERPRFAAEVRAELAELRRESEGLRDRLRHAADVPTAHSQQIEMLARETDEGATRQTILSAAASISAQTHDLPAGGYGEGLDLGQDTEGAPVVGYPETRLRLWDLLEEVRSSGEARVVLLDGDGDELHGVPRWLRSHAEETAWGVSLVARFDASGRGLPGVAESVVRCGGLDRRSAQKQVQRFLERHGADEPYEVGLLTEFLRPEGQLNSNMAFLTPLSRRAVFDRLLRRVAADRPVVLTLEAIDAASVEDEVVPLLRHILQGNLAVSWPVLVVAHLQPPQRWDRLASTAELLKLPGAERCVASVGETAMVHSDSFSPFSGVQQAPSSDAGQAVLYAEEDQAAETSAPSPPTVLLHHVPTVLQPTPPAEQADDVLDADDVGVVEETDAAGVVSIELRAARPASPPSTRPHRVSPISEFDFFDESLLPAPPVEEQVAATAAIAALEPIRPQRPQLAPRDRAAVLECAAIFGPSFPFDGLAAVVEATGGTTSLRLDQIWRLLLTEGVWIEIDGGDRAAFANVRHRQEAIERLLTDNARRQHLHLEVARAKRDGVAHRGNIASNALEVAEHFVQANEGLAAVDALMDATGRAMASGRDDSASRILDYALRMATRVAGPSMQRVRADILVAQGQLALRARKLERANHHFTTARTLAAQFSLPGPAAEALVGLAKVADIRSDVHTAEARFSQAAAELEKIDLDGQAEVWPEAARARLGQALAASRAGHWEAARSALAHLIDTVQRNGRPETTVGSALLATGVAMFARVEYELGDLTRFVALARRALALSEGIGVINPTLGKLFRSLAQVAAHADLEDPELQQGLEARAALIFKALGLT